MPRRKLNFSLTTYLLLMPKSPYYAGQYKQKRAGKRLARVRARPIRRTTARSFPNQELKFHDVALDDAVIAAAGTITDTINIIPQDNTAITRNGRKVVVKNINWRYRISLPEVDAVATPGPGEDVRVMLYLDKQCNGAGALVSTNAGILATVDYQSFNNLSNKNRFKILYDKVHTLVYRSLASGDASQFSSAGNRLNRAVYLKCNIPLEFDSSAATGAIATIRSNNLGVLLISSSGVAGFQSNFRLRYTDA